jgi:hypothetical protein
MAYVTEWELLAEVLERVMAAGSSRDQAKADICRAITDGAVKIRGKLGRHTTRGFRSVKTVLEGKDFQIPTEIKSEDLDWDRSRPVQPWLVRRATSSPAGYWDLEWIKLFGPDVTNVLCPARKVSETVHPAPSQKKATSRSRPALERATRMIQKLYLRGIPEQASEPNARLCRRVGEELKKEGLPPVSDDTILRAAGRRK